MERYSRNETMLTPEENVGLRKKRVFIAGCGGLGGYIVEMLARLGVGYLTLADPDVFEIHNLNRQIFSDSDSLGKPKVVSAKERLKKVNPDVDVQTVMQRLTWDNCQELCRDHDLLMDGLDNISSRKVLQMAGEQLKIPLIHGAIAGWYGQVATVFPGDRTLDRLYPGDENTGAETILGNPSFIPAMVASVQVSEALKVLINRGDILQNRMLHIDCLTHTYEVFEI